MHGDIVPGGWWCARCTTIVGDGDDHHTAHQGGVQADLARLDSDLVRLERRSIGGRAALVPNRFVRALRSDVGGAEIADGPYRYALASWWGTGPWACFILLNPNIARGDVATHRCVSFARAWGLDGLAIVNLFAYRATDPRALERAMRDGVDVVGPCAELALDLFTVGAALVVAAWGGSAFARPRARVVRQALRGRGVALRCLGVTRAGDPLHTRLSKARRLQPYVW